MDPVVILHGLGRTAASMKKLARRVEEAGFDSVLVNYPSRKATISALVDSIWAYVPMGTRVHFVGHSLGGILAKDLMRRVEPEWRGRIVQLGAPNLGSEIAQRASLFGPIMGPIMGPALGELVPHPPEDDKGLDIGAIAGTAALEAYGVITGIPGENDGKVSVASAWGAAPEGKRLKLPVAHSTMMLDDYVIHATVHFLRHGMF
jgi:pimeloyl-ACP methyl ester carboxylesterase